MFFFYATLKTTEMHFEYTLQPNTTKLYTSMLWQHKKQDERVNKKMKENGPQNVNARLHWWFLHTHGQNSPRKRAGLKIFGIVCLRGAWRSAMRLESIIFRVRVIFNWENTDWAESKHRLKLGWNADILTNYSICWMKITREKSFRFKRGEDEYMHALSNSLVRSVLKSQNTFSLLLTGCVYYVTT